MFNINYPEKWDITGGAELLNISALSGKGATQITVTTIEDNNKASSRTCTLAVNGNGVSDTVEIVQLAGLKSGLGLTISDELILSESFITTLNFGTNVSYFYAGTLDASSLGWSDARIAEALRTMQERRPETNYALSWEDYEPGEKIILSLMGCDKDGNHGEIVKKNIEFPSDFNAPKAYISYISTSRNYWTWETTINASASEYYMFTQTQDAASTYLMTKAALGLILKELAQGSPSYVQSGAWTQSIDQYQQLVVATWAMRDKTWSPVINTRYGYLSSDYSRPKEKDRKKET